MLISWIATNKGRMFFILSAITRQHMLNYVKCEDRQVRNQFLERLLLSEMEIVEFNYLLRSSAFSSHWCSPESQLCMHEGSERPLQRFVTLMKCGFYLRLSGYNRLLKKKEKMWSIALKPELSLTTKPEIRQIDQMFSVFFYRNLE